MSTLLKKVTSAMTVGAVLATTLGTSIVAAASGFLPYAEALADAQIITKSSTEAGYRLADNALRQEVAGMMMSLNKATYTANSCENKFSDVSATKPNSWVCKVVEAALEKGLIATNAKFRPEDKITRAEALAMILKGQGIAITTGAEASFNDTSITWQKDVANTALAAKIVSANASFRPNDLVTRGELFVMAANAAGLKIASDDLDLDDLFGDDTTSTGTTTDTTSTGTTTNPTTPVVVKAGDLNVSLNPASPSSADLPNTAEGVEVAKFDLTSGSNDISISTVKLTRKGLGASSAVDNVALFANGARVSKAKTFNSSDDMADVVISPALVIKAGSTVTLTAKVNTKATAGAFAIELTDMVSSAANVKGIKTSGASFEVKSSTTATKITPSNDGSVTNPKLGTQQADLLKFKLKNDTTSNEDVSLYEITLKEDGGIDESTELANVALYYNGSKVANGVSNGTKYFTFKFSSPILIGDGKTEKFVVRGDVVGGASETINFVLDNDLDITATASKYGYVSVNGAAAGTVSGSALTVQAGEVTLMQVDPTDTEVRKDKDDVILGTIKVISKAGKSLELENFRATIKNTGNASNISALLENVELFDSTNGTIYGLDAGAAGTTETYSEELNIAMPSSGELVLVIRADTLNVAAVNTAKFIASVSYDTTSSAVGTFSIKETADDKYVTDVTPSSITFKTVNGTSSSLSLNTVAMSATKSAVIGSKGVESMIFELKSDNDSSDLTVDEIKVKGTVVDHSSTIQTNTITPTVVNAAAAQTDTVTINGTAIVFTSDATPTVAEITAGLTAAINGSAQAGVVTATDNATNLTVLADSPYDTFTVAVSANLANVATVAAANDGTDTVVSNSRVNALYLYNGTTLLDQVSGSNIGTDGIATFDGFNVKIAKNSSQRFTITADLLDSANQANDTIRFAIAGYSADDDDSDPVYISGDADNDGDLVDDGVINSPRTLTIKGAGGLTVTVDNTDSETDKAKNILAGVTSPFVASYELSATNEAILVKDFRISESTAGSLNNAVSEVIVYANDKTTELARKTVTSDTLDFDNINFTVEEGSENVYIKLVTSKQGRDQAGSQTSNLALTFEVRDAEGASSNKVVSNPAVTGASNLFSVLPVKISSIAFVDSANGVTRATKLNNGTNNVAIIAVTTDSSTNTDSTDASSLKTILEDVKLDVFNYDGGAFGTAINSMTIEKVNGTNAAIPATLAVNGGGGAYTIAGGTVASDAFFDLAGTDYQLDNGTTTYFVVKANVTKDTSNDSDDYVKVQFDELNNSNVVYKSDDASLNNTSVTDLRISLNKIDGTQINE